tara:strand:- start:37 stop:432 length:396 start_codon:yes stop_codon:yes gene_type:complete
MDLFHKIMELVDKNSDKIPEGDYLELCDTIHELRRQVKPPSFLLDQNQPLWMGREAPVYRPTVPITDGQPPEWFEDEDEEIAYPGLNAFLDNLHAGWAATDNIGPVEPGAYYPPPRDGTTVVEVTMMEIDT